MEAVDLCGLAGPDKQVRAGFFTVLPFLARDGLDFIGQLYENVHLDCPDHVVLVA
jgi:hypothetical protein